MNVNDQRQAAARRYGEIMSSAAQRQVTQAAGMALAPVIACAEDDTIDSVVKRAERHGSNVVGVAVWRTRTNDIELMRLLVDQEAPAPSGQKIDSYQLSGDVSIGMILDSQPGRAVPDSLADTTISWGTLTAA